MQFVRMEEPMLVQNVHCCYWSS